MTRKTIVWVYPIIFGVYPVIALLGANIAHIEPQDALRSFVISLIFALGLCFVSRIITRNWDKAAVICVVVLGVFYSYGHIYEAIEGRTLWGVTIGRHLVVLPAMVILAVVLLFVAIKIKIDNLGHRLLTIISVILIIIPSIIGARGWLILHQRFENNTPIEPLEVAESLPDVYLVILDSYTRGDILEEVYAFDNSKFIRQLEDIGFVVSDCSMSNYSWTPLSLSSMLMMDYMYNIDGKVQQGTTHLNYMDYHKYISNSNVRKVLTERGYSTVAFATGHSFTAINDADVYITGQQNPLEKLEPGYGSNEFDELLLRTTMARVVSEFIDSEIIPKINGDNSSAKKHYNRILFLLDTLDSVYKIPGPKFVFAHLSAPHAPFVFTPDGEYLYTKEAMAGYPDEIQYLNFRMIPILKRIIDESPVPPIIILMGDHGQSIDFRNHILYAIYTPEGIESLDFNTPINTFRWLFSEYYALDYPLLEEHSYFSQYDTALDLEDLPIICNEE